MCDRHVGVGADGVILYDKSEVKECAAKFRIFNNNDGFEAEMCGNG